MRIVIGGMDTTPGAAMSTTEDHSQPSGAVQQAPGLWRTDRHG
jgi:hypothetical protein